MIECSCGNASDHVIATRRTADDKIVKLWSSGWLTWALGNAIKGSAFPRTAEQRTRAMKAGWLVIGEVCLYDADDVSLLVAAARWAADRDGLPGTVRTRVRVLRAPRELRPTWETQECDRDGRPTLRVWRLPRLLGFAGLAVFHERGSYEVMQAVRGRSPLGGRADGDVYAPTGFKRATLREVLALLPTLIAREVS